MKKVIVRIILLGILGGAGWAGISPDGNYVIVGANFNHISYVIDHVAQTLSPTGVTFWNLCGDHSDVMSASDGKTYLIVFNCWDIPAVYRVDVSIPEIGRAHV